MNERRVDSKIIAEASMQAVPPVVDFATAQRAIEEDKSRRVEAARKEIEATFRKYGVMLVVTPSLEPAGSGGWTIGVKATLVAQNMVGPNGRS